MHNNSKIFIIALSLFAANTVLADTSRLPAKVLSTKKENLLSERSIVKLQDEEVVQQDVNKKPTTYALLVGTMNPNSLTVSAPNGVKRYSFNNSLQAVAFDYRNSLLTTSIGYFGLGAAIGYTTTQSLSDNPTALHLIPVTASINFRGQASSTQKVIPLLAIGPSIWSYMQRGLDGYNTSGSFATLDAQAGLSFPLKNFGFSSLRTPYEMMALVDHQFANSDTSSNLNSTNIFVGASVQY